MKQASQEYINGIREGRATLRAMPGNGLTVDDIPALLDNINRTIQSGFAASSPVGQMLRGERDFWQRQLKGN